MSNFDKYITKEGCKFYIDLDEWREQNDIPLESGDTIKFSHEKKKYLGKIGNGKYGVVEVSIQKDLTV